MIRSFLDKTLPILISIGIVLVLLSPFPRGSVEIWSVHLFELICIFTFMLWGLQRILHKTVNLKYSPLYIPVFLLFVLVLLQLIPWPESILKLVSPSSANIWGERKASLEHIFGTDIEILYTITLYKYATVQKLILYISYAMFFVVAVHHLKKTDQYMRYFWVIFTVGSIEAILGILQYIMSGGEVPASGTYVNPNTFSGLMITIIPLSLCYGLYSGRQAGGEVSSIRHIFTKASFSTQLIMFFATGLMAVSLMLARSRGAILSFVISIVFLYMLLSRRKTTKHTKWFIGGFLAIIFIYSLWIGVDPVVEKFSVSKEELPKRTLIWTDTIEMIKDFPIFGTGLGSYAIAYSLYKEDAYWALLYSHAHNDYLETLAELGILGLILVLWAVIAFYRQSLNTLFKGREERDSLNDYLLIGSLSSIFALLFHAFTEFNFQIPANMYYFVFLLALCTSISDLRLKRGSVDSGRR